ncbi:MAG: sodium:calcium antiporter [Deltaproteobacteria bacterium]|nr:sodium:calcium antiporter [Deltaproteobacteria bacterium]
MNILQYLTDESILASFLKTLSPTVIILMMVANFIILTKGADVMIDGVVSLARRTGLPKVVIGATILSLGTTMPEAIVSVTAAWMGNAGLALGNGVGSIVADTGLIFGLVCIFSVVPINRYILNRTGWVQVGAATLLVLLSFLAWIKSPEAPVISRSVGFLFLSLLLLYLFMTYRWACRKESLGYTDDDASLTHTHNLTASATMVIGGLVLVVGGARFLVPCAVEFAYRVGVPEDIVAATIVALGTSLPELMTAMTSIRKKHPEIALGNVVGADVLNCLFVIGAAAAARPLAIPSNFMLFHYPAMLIILFSFRGFIFMNRRGCFYRWQGLWLLAVYLLYVTLQYSLGINGGT